MAEILRNQMVVNGIEALKRGIKKLDKVEMIGEVLSPRII